MEVISCTQTLRIYTCHKMWQLNLSPTKPAHGLVLLLSAFPPFLYHCVRCVRLIEEHLPYRSHALPWKNGGNGNPPLANEFMGPVVRMWLALRRPLGMKMHDLLWWWLAFSYHFYWKLFGNVYMWWPNISTRLNLLHTSISR